MPCFTGPISREGEVIVDAWVGNATVSGVAESWEEIQKENMMPLKALLDTGATHSCVTDRLAREMGLTVVARRQFASVSEVTDGNVYEVYVHIPFPARTAHDSNLHVTVGSTGRIEVSGIPIEPAFDVLLGMDVIALGSLHVSGRRFTFCL